MRIVAATLYAAAVAVLAALLLALVGGGLSVKIAWTSLVAGMAFGLCTAWMDRTPPIARSPIRPWEWAAITAFTLFALRAFLWLVFKDNDAIYVISPNNLGDLSLHLTYIRHFAAGAAFWPDNPIFAGGKLTYPIGVDLLNSLLVLAGLDVFRGLIWTGLVASALSGVALWRWGRGVALTAFLANGGLMGFAIFGTGEFRDYQSDLAWKSLPLALFVTQRGLLFALPAGLFLLASWRARWFGAGDAWRLPRWGEWLLYAAMPLFHLHTFLFLSLLLGSWFVLNPESRRAIGGFVAAAFVPASALTFLVTGMMRGTSMLGWKAGWMVDDAKWVEWCADHFPGSPEVVATALFWPMNFGVLPVLVGLACVRLLRRGAPRWPASAVFPALLIFILCCFVKFAPWEWDNTKLMLWSYLIVTPLAWETIIAPWRQWRRVVAAIALFGSGFLSLIGGLDSTHQGYQLAKRSEVDFVAAAVRGIPIGERFAAYPTYNHPLLLSGRKLMMGYSGHVWSHGLSWTRLQSQVDALMNGSPRWREIAREHQVRYLFWGERESENYPNSKQPWLESSLRVAVGPWGAIYDLAEPQPTVQTQ